MSASYGHRLQHTGGCYYGGAGAGAAGAGAAATAAAAAAAASSCSITKLQQLTNTIMDIAPGRYWAPFAHPLHSLFSAPRSSYRLDER